MKITKGMRDWALANGLSAADATDDNKVKDFVLGALASNKLTQAKFAELCTEAAQLSVADLVAKAVASAMEPVLAALKTATPAAGAGAAAAGAGAGAGGAAEPALTDEEKRIKAMLEKLGVKAVAGGTGAAGDDPADPTRVIFKSQGNGKANARVKSVSEKYTSTQSDLFYPSVSKGGVKHPSAGKPAVYCGEQLKTSSRLGKAVSQAYFKWCLTSGRNKSVDMPRGLRMTDEDRDLLNFALHEMEWSGVIKTGDDGYDWEHKVNRRKLAEYEIKSLLDDSVSGGIEIAPIEFDDALVTYPVLFGELFPEVNVVDVSRGRRMKGGSVTNPTFASSSEGTNITVFDTTSFVAAFDTTIYVAAAAVEIGMDFEEDSPTNIGSIIMEKYGEKAQEWLDRVIAVGDGVTEPQGIFNAAGTTSVTTDMGTAGPATVSDYEQLMFAVPKQYRAAKGSRNIYVGNETSYRRARAIAVGPTDERRVFGMTHADFLLLDTPYKIQANIPNSSIAYMNAGFYRMYRRLGFNIRVETAGNYLATRNLRLIVARMRYGGRVELGQAVAVALSAQS